MLNRQVSESPILQHNWGFTPFGDLRIKHQNSDSAAAVWGVAVPLLASNQKISTL